MLGNTNKLLIGGLLLSLIACNADTSGRQQVSASSSCAKCHNGSKGHDYSGPGIQTPPMSLKRYADPGPVS